MAETHEMKPPRLGGMSSEEEVPAKPAAGSGLASVALHAYLVSRFSTSLDKDQHSLSTRTPLLAYTQPARGLSGKPVDETSTRSSVTRFSSSTTHIRGLGKGHKQADHSDKARQCTYSSEAIGKACLLERERVGYRAGHAAQGGREAAAS
jgi:hypothetical protein